MNTEAYRMTISVTKPFFLKSCNWLTHSRRIGPTFCSCLKTAIIVPVAKNLNDCCSGSHPHSDQVLRETGSLAHQRHHPCQPGPLYQYAFKTSWSTEDAITTAHHSVFHTSGEQECQEAVCWLNSAENVTLWAWVQHFATGYWDFLSSDWQSHLLYVRAQHWKRLYFQGKISMATFQRKILVELWGEEKQ